MIQLRICKHGSQISSVCCLHKQRFICFCIVCACFDTDRRGPELSSYRKTIWPSDPELDALWPLTEHVFVCLGPPEDPPPRMVSRGFGWTWGHRHKSSENKGSPKQNVVFNKADRARIKAGTLRPAPWRESDHSDA